MFRRQPAVISRRANPRPCGTPAALAKRSYRPTVLFGAADRTPVRVAQRRLGVRVTGDLDRRTWRAVRRYQRAHDLPVTGALDKPTWGSLGPSSVRWSVTEGYGPRRAARYAARHWSGVRLHRASAGRPVAFLQTALRLPTADRNGFVGRGTARALREFKAARGMAGNANVNGRVWRALPARR
jgi:peptidoglycan hydrolase-like protein with peptidoglycan-binding domain